MPWEETLGSPKESHGSEPMGEGTLWSPRDRMRGGPGPTMGGKPLGVQRDPMEGNLRPSLGTHLKIFCDAIAFKKKTEQGHTRYNTIIWYVDVNHI